LRDILTVLASIVILILTAAVVAPPLIEWEAHRPLVDQAISEAAGTEARTEGRIGVRLLPSPRIRVDRIRLGSGNGASPSLTADFVWAEIALTPLLRGEVRFTETRIGRADIQVPLAADGGWRIPQDMLTGDGRARQWAIDNLSIAEFLLTAHRPATGRVDQFHASQVLVEGQKLIGPWRVEGSTSGVPFRFSTSELAPDKSVLVKLTGGGDAHPRFDIDGRLSLDEGAGGSATPLASGKAKLQLGPPGQVAAAGIPIPVTIDMDFKTVGESIALSNINLEAGEGGGSLRMGGSGSVGIGDPRLSLRLEGRRLDADSFIVSSTGEDFATRLGAWSLPQPAFPIDLDLTLDSIGLGQEELTQAKAQASIEQGRVQVRRLSFTAPGTTQVTVSGEADLSFRNGLNGSVAINSAASDRFARYLGRLQLNSPFLQILDGRPLRASSDISYAGPILSLSRLRVEMNGTTLTGNLRHTAPEGSERGRLEAQVAVQGLDLDRMPQISSMVETMRNVDLGLILDARDVKAGGRGSAGRFSARIASDGPAIRVEELNIVDLGGANARVSGRIAADGSGRIAGKITAPRAAPLIDLVGSVWIGGLANLVPSFLREGDLNLDIVTERVAPPAGSRELRLRTVARGQAAGGTFDGRVDSADGRTESLELRLATANTARWLGARSGGAASGPSEMLLKGDRAGSGAFNLILTGNVAGTRLTTSTPMALGGGDDRFDSGAVEATSLDAAPLLSLLGYGNTAQPVPLQLTVSFGRDRETSLLNLSGQVAGNPVQGRAFVRTLSDFDGEISVARLSLPWLVSTLALDTAPGTQGGWSTTRFGEKRPFKGGRVLVKSGAVDLGNGLSGTGASFNLAATPDGIAISAFDMALSTGRVRGEATVTRQGTLASIVGEGSLLNVPIAALAPSSPVEAKLSGSLKFGTSAETVAGLITNLGGSGDWRINDFRIAGADPTVFPRALRRVLGEAEPLVEGRSETLLADELAKAPLTTPLISSSAAIVGGLLRLSPFVVDAGAATWQGVVAYDLRTFTLDAKGALAAKASPPEWTGAPPSIGLNWRGSLSAPVRVVDPGSFRNGLATIVLKRELEKIEAFERAAAERQRQIDAQQAERRRQAADEAARQARLAQEAERARQEAEQLQNEQRRNQQNQEQGVEPQPAPSGNTSPPGTAQ
jgi:hypothetical protein